MPYGTTRAVFALHRLALRGLVAGTLFVAACISAPPQPTAAPAVPAPKPTVAPTAAPAVNPTAVPTALPAPKPTDVAPAKPAAVTKVPIILNFVYDGTFSPLLYGKDKGIFQGQGIELDVIPGRGSDLALQQLNENKVQFAFVDLTTYLGQRAKGQTQSTAVMAYHNAPATGIVSSAPISQPQDMEGKSWGTTAFSAGRYLLPITLKANGVDPAKVKVELLDFGVLYPSMFEGKIDSAEAFEAGSLVGVQLAAEKQGKTIYFAPLSNWGLTGYSKIIIVRDDLIKNDPDLVRRVIGSITRSLNEALAKANDDELWKLSTAFEPTLEREQTTRQWTQFKQSAKSPGPLDSKVVQQNLAYMAEGQNVSTDLKPEQLFTNEFIPKN